MTSALVEQIRSVMAGVRSLPATIPFTSIIKALCDQDVIRFDTTTAPVATLHAQITDAMKDACAKVRATPIVRPRPNEVGNDMEAFVIDALVAQGLTAEKPKSATGKGKSTGYPDVVIKRAGLPDTYLEVKSFATGVPHNSFRAFYLSPSEDPKVTSSGHHLLVGFEMASNGNQYTPVTFEIVDLYGLDCDMKAEFNSDNRRIYDSVRLLAKVRL